jgi:hypothetical protein
MALGYYYPNRPTLIPADPANPMAPKPDYLNSLESQNKYRAEYKWNGDNTFIYTDDLSFWNRDRKRLCYTPHPDVLKELKQFPKGCILNAETMHRHTKTTKHLIIVHSVMAWKGKLLTGKTWGDARHLLEEQSWLPRTVGTQLSYCCHVLLAESIPSGGIVSGIFWRMFQEACRCDDSIEGIILKDPTGLLQFSSTKLADVSYMMKIRKPCKKYSF